MSTIDGGHTWQQLANTTGSYNDLYTYDVESNAVKTIAVGNNGVISRVIIENPSTKYHNIGAVNYASLASSENVLSSVWAKVVNNNLSIVVLGYNQAHSLGQIFYTSDGNSNSFSWQSPSTFIVPVYSSRPVKILSHEETSGNSEWEVLVMKGADGTISTCLLT